MLETLSEPGVESKGELKENWVPLRMGTSNSDIFPLLYFLVAY